MKIEFESKKLQKIMNSEKELVRAYGAIRAKKVRFRLMVLSSAHNLKEVPIVPPERCHQLRGELQGCFAVDLEHPFRLVFKPAEPVPYSLNNSIALEKVTAVIILSVEDYHA